MANHFDILATRTPGTVWKCKKIWHQNMSPPGLKMFQYANGEEWRTITNSSRKNEAAGPKQKWHSVVDVSGRESKVWGCKEEYCRGTWNVGAMNQGKLDMVKQEMARVNIGILGISELKWTIMGEFNSGDHYVYYWENESLRGNGATLIVNRRVWKAVLGCGLKNDRMVSIHFQGKPFNITVIQVCGNHWCWKGWSWLVLWRSIRLSRTNTRKRCPFHHRGLKCKSRKSEDTQNNRHVWPWSTKWSRAKPNCFVKRTHWSYQTSFSNNSRQLYTWTSQDV